MRWVTILGQIKNNQWLILAILFFIAWKFFLIHTLWQDRALPPEPDDSYNYITQIASVALCPEESCPKTISFQNNSGFAYLSYRLFFGLLAKITQLSPEETYHLSFYLGTIFLALFLPFFIKVFSQNQRLIAWSIFFLSFYHGLGESHGFYWVVPSFFLLLLLFILFVFVAVEERKFNPWLAGGVAVVYTFSHPMSIFLIPLLPLYLLFLNFFTYRVIWITWKRVAFILLIILATSLASHNKLLNPVPEENSYSLQAVISKIPLSTKHLPRSEADEIRSSLSLSSKYQGLLKERADTLSQVYLRWLLPSWIFIIPFLLGFFILLYKRALEIISLYFAAFFFFIITTLLDPLGYRTALVLWPVTYLFFAMSSWYGLEILREKTKGWMKYVLLGLSILVLTLFFLLNAAFSFFFNENINVRNDYPIEPELIHYLEALPPQATVAFSKEFVIAEMWNIPTVRAQSVQLTTRPEYIITTNFNQIQEKPRATFSQRIKFIATKLGLHSSPHAPEPSSALPPGYAFEKEFGVFSLHKRLP